VQRIERADDGRDEHGRTRPLPLTSPMTIRFLPVANGGVEEVAAHLRVGR
jgi:hypothetical protein